MPKHRKKSSKSNKWLLITVIALIALIGVGLGLYYGLKSDNKNIATTSSKQTITSTPSTSSSQPTTTTTPTTTKSSNPGGVIDENGQSSSSLPPSSDWASSSNGDITLQQPSANAEVQNGDTVSGLASVSSVNFALSDSSVGLIDQGTLSVVNGKFAGKMEFTTQSSTGTLQIYYPNRTNGAEEDLVEIDVSFN